MSKIKRLSSLNENVVFLLFADFHEVSLFRDHYLLNALSVMQLQLICNNYFSIQLVICLKERIQKRIRFLIEKSNLYFCLRPSELLMTLSDWVFVEMTIWIMAFLTAYKEVKILSKYLVRAARRTLLLLIYRRQKQNKNYLWGWGEQKHKKRKKLVSTFLSCNDSNLSFRRKQSSNFIIANCKTWFFFSLSLDHHCILVTISTV